MKAALNGRALLAGVLGLCVAAGIGFGVKSNADRQQALAEAEAAAQAAARQEAPQPTGRRRPSSPTWWRRDR